MISVIYKSLKDETFQRLEKFRSGALILIESVEKEDLQQLAEWTGFAESDFTDVFDIFEVPRLERHPEGLIIHLRHPQLKPEVGLFTELLSLVILDKGTVFIAKQENQLVQEFLESNKVVTTQKSKLFLWVLSRMNKIYTTEIKKVSDEVMRQKRAVTKVRHHDINRLIESEDRLNQYLSALIPMKNLFEIIAKNKLLPLYDSDADLYEDVMIGFNQLVDISQVNLRTIQSLRDSYQIIFTNHLNNTMKFLASFTIIMTIPNIVAGLFGMNVMLPLAELNNAFHIVLGIIVASCLFTLGIFYKQRWL